MFMNQETQHSIEISSPQMICRFNAITIKIPAKVFQTHTPYFKFLFKGKYPRICKIIMKKTEKEIIIRSDIKPYYKPIVINTVWYWESHRQINQ